MDDELDSVGTPEDNDGPSGQFPCALLIQQCLRAVGNEQPNISPITSRRITVAQNTLRALAAIYRQDVPTPAPRDDIHDSLRAQLRHARVDLQAQLFRHRYLYSFLQELKDTRSRPASNWQAFRHYNYFIFRNFITTDPSVNTEKLPLLFQTRIETAVISLTKEDKTQFYVRIVSLLREYVDIAVENFVNYVDALDENRVSSYMACLMSYYSAFISATLKLSSVLAEFIQFINERFHVNWYLFNQRIFYQYFYQRPEVQEKVPAFLEMCNNQNQPGLINLLRSYALFVDNMDRLDTHWEIQRKRIDILNERNVRTESEWLERDWKMFEEMRRITKTNYWFVRTDKEKAIQDMEELDSQLLELLSSTWLTSERIVTLAGNCICEDCILVEFFQTLLPANHRLRNNSDSAGIRKGNTAVYDYPVPVKEVWTTKHERPLVRLLMCGLCQESVLLNAYLNHILTKHPSSSELQASAKGEEASPATTADQFNNSTETITSEAAIIENNLSLLVLEKKVKSNTVTVPVDSPHVKRFCPKNDADRLLQFELPPSLAASARALHGMSQGARYIEYTLSNQTIRPISQVNRSQSHNKPFSIQPKYHHHVAPEHCFSCTQGASGYLSQLNSTTCTYRCIQCCETKETLVVTIRPTQNDDIPKRLSIGIAKPSTNLRSYATLSPCSARSATFSSNSDLEDFCVNADCSDDNIDNEVIVILRQRTAADNKRSTAAKRSVNRTIVSTEQPINPQVNVPADNALVGVPVRFGPFLINTLFSIRNNESSTDDFHPLVVRTDNSDSPPVVLEQDSSSSDGGPEYILFTSDEEDTPYKTPKTPTRGPKRHLPEIKPNEKVPEAMGSILSKICKVYVDVELEPVPPDPFRPDADAFNEPPTYTSDVFSIAHNNVTGAVLIPSHTEELSYQYEQTQDNSQVREIILCAPSTRLNANGPAPGFFLTTGIADQLLSYERGEDPPELFVDADENLEPQPAEYPNQDSIHHADGLDDASRLYRAFVRDAARTSQINRLNAHLAQTNNTEQTMTVQDYDLFEDAPAPVASAVGPRIPSPLPDDSQKFEDAPTEPVLEDLPEFELPDFVPGDDFPEDFSDCLEAIERLKQQYMLEDIPRLLDFSGPAAFDEGERNKAGDNLSGDNPQSSSIGEASAIPSQENATGASASSMQFYNVCTRTVACTTFPNCNCFLACNVPTRVHNKYGMSDASGARSAQTSDQVFVFTAGRSVDDAANLMPPPPAPAPVRPHHACRHQNQEPSHQEQQYTGEPAAKRHHTEASSSSAFASIERPQFSVIQPKIKADFGKSTDEDVITSLGQKLGDLNLSDSRENLKDLGKAKKTTTPSSSSCDMRDRLFVKISEDLDSVASVLWSPHVDKKIKPSPTAPTAASGAIPKSTPSRMNKKRQQLRARNREQTELEVSESDNAILEHDQQLRTVQHFETPLAEADAVDYEPDPEDLLNDNEVDQILSFIEGNSTTNKPMTTSWDDQKKMAKVQKKERQKLKRKEERQVREASANEERERQRLLEQARRGKLDKEQSEIQKRLTQRRQDKEREAAKRAAQHAEHQLELKKRQEQSKRDKAREMAKKAAQTEHIATKKKKPKPEPPPAPASSEPASKKKKNNKKKSSAVPAPPKTQPLQKLPKLASIDDDTSSYEPWSSDEFVNSDEVLQTNVENTDSDEDDDSVSMNPIEQEVTEELPAMIRIKRVGSNTGAASCAPTVTISLKGATPEQDKLLYTLVNGQAEVAEPPPQLTAVAAALLPMPDMSVLNDPALTKKQRKKKTQQLTKQAAKVSAANAALQQPSALEQQPEGAAAQSNDGISREVKITMAVDKSLQSVRAGGEVKTIPPLMGIQTRLPRQMINSDIVRLPSNFSLPPGITITKVRQPEPNKAPVANQLSVTSVRNYNSSYMSNTPHTTITPISSATYVHRNITAQTPNVSISAYGGSTIYPTQHQQLNFYAGSSDQRQQNQFPTKPPYVPFYVTQPKSGSLIVVDTEKLIEQGAVKKRRNKKKKSGNNDQTDSTAPPVVRPKKYRLPPRRQLPRNTEGRTSPPQQAAATSDAEKNRMITLKNPLFSQQPFAPTEHNLRHSEDVQQDQLAAQLSEQATISKGENGMVTIRRPGIPSSHNKDAMSMQEFLRDQSAPLRDWNSFSLFSNPSSLSHPLATPPIQTKPATNIIDAPRNPPILDLVDINSSPMETFLSFRQPIGPPKSNQLSMSNFPRSDVRSSSDHPWKELLSNLPPEVEVTTLPSVRESLSGPSTSLFSDNFSTSSSYPPFAEPRNNSFLGTSGFGQYDTASQFPPHALDRSAINIPDVTLINSSGLGMPLNEIMPQFTHDEDAIQRAMLMIRHSVPPPPITHVAPRFLCTSSVPSGAQGNTGQQPSQLSAQWPSAQQGNETAQPNSDGTYSFDNVFAPKESTDGELDPVERDVEAFKLFCQQSVPPEKKEKVVHLYVKDIVIKRKNKK